MANKKYFYYILVITQSGPKFVTSIGDHHTAFWNELEKPHQFTKSRAEDITFGLCMNFYTAYIVTSLYEIEHQPYNYEYYNIDFTKKESDKNGDLDR